jgi:uncharacterized membrane protein YGL010W
MNPFFIEQMAMYSSYHRDWRNKATHFVGIPAIAFSLFIPLSWVVLFDLGGVAVSLAVLLYLGSILFYLWLDRALGLAMAVLFLPVMLVGIWVGSLGTATGWTVFALFFVGGWIFQLVGHAFEGRRPALADNILQALIGPLFLMAEVVVALGFKRDMHDAVEARWRNYSAESRAKTARAGSAG